MTRPGGLAMPEWLNRTFDVSASVSWETLVVRLLAALTFGLAITVVYRGTRHASDQSGTFPATLVLLCVLIAMVTQVIGDNVARAFSLVGALSIVRFRTVVRDTKDTAFVIFAVAVGMAAGAGQPLVAVCGLAVVGLAALLFRDRSDFLTPFARETLLTVKLGWSAALEALVVETLSKHASEIEPLGVSTARHGTAMELSFRARLHPTTRPTELVAELNGLDGVQSVELTAQRPEA